MLVCLARALVEDSAVDLVDCVEDFVEVCVGASAVDSQVVKAGRSTRAFMSPTWVLTSKALAFLRLATRLTQAMPPDMALIVRSLVSRL